MPARTVTAAANETREQRIEVIIKDLRPKARLYRQLAERQIKFGDKPAAFASYASAAAGPHA